MKTTVLAALALAALVPGLAGAETPADTPAPEKTATETIGKERFGCQARELIDRLFQLVAADEEVAFGRLLQSSLATGDCRMWKPGEAVRIESRTSGYGCLAADGSAGPCYWTPVSALDKPE